MGTNPIEELHTSSKPNPLSKVSLLKPSHLGLDFFRWTLWGNIQSIKIMYWDKWSQITMLAKNVSGSTCWLLDPSLLKHSVSEFHLLKNRFFPEVTLRIKWVITYAHKTFLEIGVCIWVTSRNPHESKQKHWNPPSYLKTQTAYVWSDIEIVKPLLKC